jgi:hypothetical protein
MKHSTYSRTSWFLWCLFTVPAVLFLLLRTYQDKAGVTHSDWGDLVRYLQEGPVARWSYWSEIACWSILVPILVAWFAQYLLRVGWHFFRARRAAS